MQKSFPGRICRGVSFNFVNKQKTHRNGVSQCRGGRWKILESLWSPKVNEVQPSSHTMSESMWIIKISPNTIHPQTTAQTKPFKKHLDPGNTFEAFLAFGLHRHPAQLSALFLIHPGRASLTAPHAPAQPTLGRGAEAVPCMVRMTQVLQEVGKVLVGRRRGILHFLKLT